MNYILSDAFVKDLESENEAICLLPFFLQARWQKQVFSSSVLEFILEILRYQWSVLQNQVASPVNGKCVREVVPVVAAAAAFRSSFLILSDSRYELIRSVVSSYRVLRVMSKGTVYNLFFLFMYKHLIPCIKIFLLKIAVISISCCWLMLNKPGG